MEFINWTSTGYRQHALSLLFIFILFQNVSKAQEMGSRIHTACLTNSYSSQIIDSNFIVPHTISSSLLKGIDSIFEISGKTITLLRPIGTLNNRDSICISYRVFKTEFTSSAVGINLDQMKAVESEIYIAYDYTPTRKKKSTNVFGQNGLNYKGSFTRGFSLGNNQSLVLNSNLNLQLAGDIGDGITIQAAISDDNLPIQAEGNTQLLQEFDKVFIKIKKKDTEIIAGDYDWQNPETFFLKYFKKAKGLAVIHKQNINDNTTINSSANYAISRGNFSRQTLETKEGNQGPYKLYGGQGERIIRVLSGSEKVVVDGQKITRGLDHNYTISYDRAEIQFTSKTLITKDSRVIIEFEYSDQNYLRSQYSLNTEIRTEKYGAHFNYYSEQDSKSTSGDIDLDSTDLITLSDAGDDLNAAVRTGVFPLENRPIQDQSLYFKQYEASQSDSILVFAIDPSMARYFVVFSEVGIGNGDYSIDTNLGANGRAYKWVGNGVGSFSPIIRLIPPEKHQMMELGGFFDLTSHSKIQANFSLSNLDVNQFSSIDDNQNKGYGSNLSWNYKKPLGKGTRFIESSISTEFVSQRFEILNPYRTTEFQRDWNYQDTIATNEWLNNASLIYQHNNNAQASYSISQFSRGAYYNGDKQLFISDINKNGWKNKVNISLLHTKTSINKTQFLRPNILLSKSIESLKHIELGLHYNGESNKKKLLLSDDLLNSSYAFQKYGLFLNSPISDKYKIKVGWNTRTDKVVKDDFLKGSTLANDLFIQGRINISKHFKLNGNLTSRYLKIIDSSLTADEPQSTLLGHLDLNTSIKNGGLKYINSLDLNSGQEAKTEFEYVKVQNGEGQYIWLDNGDGVEQINEFQIAPLQDTANFVRVTIFNNEFIRTDVTSINQNLRINLNKLLSKNYITNHKMAGFVSKFSTISNVRISQKTSTGNTKPFFDRFRFNYRDTSLISYNFAQNHTLYFNRGRPEYDIQFGYRSNQNKIVYVTGFEQAGINEYNTRFRFNFKKSLDLITMINSGIKTIDSEFFDQNDYRIKFLKITPELSIQPKNNFRLKVNYSFIENNNLLTNTESSRSNEFTIESTWRKTSKTNISIKLSFVDVAYIGPTNTSIELVMLEGLKNGKNILWNINYIQRLSQYIDFTLIYDGRKTGESHTIHNVKAQIKANF